MNNVEKKLCLKHRWYILLIIIILTFGEEASVDIGASAKLELVDKFCYLWDMLSVDGDADAAVGVSGWMFLLVPAYPGCPGSKAVKRLLLLLLFIVSSKNFNTISMDLGH